MGKIGEERYVTQATIAQRLSVTVKHVEFILRYYGADKIVELLEARGYTVWYEKVNEYIKFSEYVG